MKVTLSHDQHVLLVDRLAGAIETAAAQDGDLQFDDSYVETPTDAGVGPFDARGAAEQLVANLEAGRDDAYLTSAFSNGLSLIPKAADLFTDGPTHRSRADEALKTLNRDVLAAVQPFLTR